MPRYKLPSIAHWTFALTLVTAFTGSAFGQGAMTDTGRAPGNPPATVEKTTPQSLVNAADTTFINFMKDPQMAWLHENMPKAKAVLIAPEVAKAGFIFGGSGVARYWWCEIRKPEAGPVPRSTRSQPPASVSRRESRCRKRSRWS